MDKIKKALLEMPVSINCYYGDPTLQWENTMEKLRKLEEVGHLGPVSIITRGTIDSDRAKELAKLKLPGLVVMYSISELPKKLEPLGHKHRYESISNLIREGVKVFAAVRPMTPPYNTTPEIVNKIFSNLKNAGCKIACVSGFRGDSSLIEQVNPDNAIEWTLRVKQMTGFDMILETAKAYDIRVFTRVNCTVSYLTGRKKPFNPYWGSPQLVRCDAIECPLRDTCGPVEPDRDIMKWLEDVVGYELEYEPDSKKTCSYATDTRLNCVSCCTTCFVQKQPRVIVKNAKTLGDLAFCRFVLGGTLCIKDGMVDGGGKDVGHVTKIQEKTKFPVHTINSWFVWATQLKKCFDCRYCISTLYPNKELVGCPPVELLKFFPSKN